MTGRARIVWGALAAGVVAVACSLAPRGAAPNEWPGVDESVIGRFVEESGRPPAAPLLDWVRGDALLFAFLCAGLLAGFVLGFWGRALFAPGAADAGAGTDGHV